MTRIGIDLGTTYSIACYHDGTSEKAFRLIDNPSGSYLFPSVVHARRDGGYTVGNSAIKVRRQEMDERYVFANIKRHIGREGNPEESYDFQVKVDQNGRRAFMGPTRLHTPEELSAEILKALKANAELVLKKKVTDVVLTYPAGFDTRQVEATNDAAIQAGFKRVDMITEPEAAAIAYGLDQGTYQTVLVYDFGGGTFDAVLMRCGKGRVEVMAKAGNPDLGGLDFDKRIREFLVERYKEDKGEDLTKSPVSMLKLLEPSEEGKRDLTEDEQTEMAVMGVDFNMATGRLEDIRYTLSRSEFENMVRDLVADTLKIVKDRVIDSADEKYEDFEPAHIDQVLLVGGMTRVPLVRRVLEETFGEKRIRSDVPADQAVAIGAAIRAAELDGRLARHTSGLDRLGRAYGVAVSNKNVQVLKVGTPYGDLESVVLTTAEDDQGFIPIIVLEGDEERATENVALYKRQHPVGLGPKGSARVVVEMMADENGLGLITVRDEVTGETYDLRG